MPVVRYQIEFEHSVPAIEQIAERFRQLTGLELKVEQWDKDLYELSADALTGDLDL